MTYGASPNEGEGLVRFHAEQAGTYRVSAQSAPGGAANAAIAVGPPVDRPLRPALVLGAAVAGGAVALALVLLTGVVTTRGRGPWQESVVAVQVGVELDRATGAGQHLDRARGAVAPEQDAV